MHEKIILEIGSGRWPFPYSGTRIITANEHYIGVDPSYHDKKILKETQDRLSETKPRHFGKLELQPGDGRELRFAKRSISEIVICNVFGAPQLYRFPSSDYYIRDSDDISQLAYESEIIKEDLISEAATVIIEGGRLVVVETITPAYIPLDKLQSMMGHRGWALSSHTFDLKEIGLFANPDNHPNHRSKRGASFVAEFTHSPRTAWQYRRKTLINLGKTFWNGLRNQL